MSINYYYDEWNNLYINEDKKDILINLYSIKLSNSSLCSLIFREKNINDYIKKILKNKNKTIDNLTNEDMHKLLVDLRSNIKLNNNQLGVIQKYFKNINEINDYIQKYSQKYGKKIIKKYNDLKLIDYELLINDNPDINFDKCINKIPKIKEYVIEYTNNYEYGYQINNKFKDSKMYYIKFYDMLMIDYDSKDLESLYPKLDKYDFLYRIYETNNGYHIYIISHKISYNNNLFIEISLELNSDKRYIIFSRYNGYITRLSPKENEEIFYHKFIKNYGTGNPNNDLNNLINILESHLE